MAQSYANSGGIGDRTASITVTTTATLGAGSVTAIIEGTYANAMWFSSGQSGREVKFDFGTARLITEAIWYQNNTSSHGTWQWQGSPDNSAWTSIGSTFTLGGVATQTITTLSGNVTSYRYYRMLQTAGTTSSSPFLQEIEFSIDGVVGSGNTAWNPANLSGVTLSSSSGTNLTATATASNSWVKAVDVKAAGAGKFYWEVRPVIFASGNSIYGFCPSALGSPNGSSSVGLSGFQTGGAIYVNGTYTGTSLGGVPGNWYGIALDLVGKLVWYRLGATGNWNGSGTANPATGVGGFNVAAITGIDAVPVAATGIAAEVVVANFGNTAFLGAVPSGFTAGWPTNVTDARVTQALAEHWLTTDPQAQVTQVLVEHWQSVASTSLQAVVTFVVAEHWMSVASVVPASGGPQVTMIH